MAMNEDAITKLDELRALVGEGRSNITFQIFEDDTSITYLHEGSDTIGNQTRISERRVKAKSNGNTPPGTPVATPVPTPVAPAADVSAGNVKNPNK